MTALEALAFLDQLLGTMTGQRSDHKTIEDAVEIIRAALTEETADAGHV